MVQFDVKRVSKGTESFMVSFDFTKTPITQVADYIIIAASKNRASDIHFDPREDGMMVRFRIDGDCQDYTFIPKAYERNLSTRLKLLANMNITESRLPQDGAIKGQFGDQYLDMRVSCLPTNEGEKIVIRILDYSRSLQGIDSLGFHPENLEKIKRMMRVPNGIILVTGATGSGKSTTTYSMLSGLNRPETNIITVEDPVEMNIEGINQVQVNAEIGMTFAAALRSILRQDPNIILIGEIRDSETAQIAVRASITGHLVLSTLHTNNALSTIERLIDMDVEKYLLSTALTGIVSQRLAKMLCPTCRYQREATKYEKKVFKDFLHKDIDVVWDANPKGCENCRHGYRGRIAFHEVLELDDTIRTALNNDKLEKEDLIKMVYTSGTITMLQDALIKVLSGLTSFEEVYKTIEIENEDADNYSEELNILTQTNKTVQPPISTSDNLLQEDLPPTIEPIANEKAVSSSGKPVETEASQPITPPSIDTTAKEKALQNVESSPKAEAIENLTEQSSPDETPNGTDLGPDIVIAPPDEKINTPAAASSEDTSKTPPANPGYKIVMPSDTPVSTEERNTSIEEEEEIKPEPEKHEPIQESYTVTSSQDLDDITPAQNTNLNIFPEIIEDTSYEQPPTLGNDEPLTEKQVYNDDDEEPINPTVEIHTNVSEMPLIHPLEKLDDDDDDATGIDDYGFYEANDTDVESPIPQIQAISVIPSASEETQELHTGSNVLTDPSIRIAQPSTPNLENDKNDSFIPELK